MSRTYANLSPITPEMVDAIRTAAAAEAETSSLRTLAPIIGIGHTTLHNFLSGAQPHPRVRRLLFDWYAGQRGPGPLAFDRLMDHLPVEVRQRVSEPVACELARGYVDSGLDVPSWLSAAGGGGVIGGA